MRFALFALLLTSAASAAEWDRFRGPNGTGVLDSGALPTEFGSKKNLVWRVDLPPGHSSPVVNNGRLFLTAVENERLYTFCLDPATGRTLWKREAPRPRREKLNSLNNPASPTPAADGANVYVFFPDYGMLSYTREGKERWRVPMGPFNNVYGIGVSPVLADDVVVLVIDQDKNSFITALGQNDGKIRWQKPRPEALSGASTPAVVARPGQPSLILAPASFRMDAYSARDGEAQWWVRGLPSEMKCVPILVGDLVFVAGFNTPENDPGKQISLPTWKELLERSDTNKDGVIQKGEVTDAHTKRYYDFIDTDNSGAIEEGEWNLHLAVMAAENGLYVYRMGSRGDASANLVWKYQRSVPQLPTPVVYRDVVYMLNDRGVLTTLDAAKGEMLKQDRVRGQSDNYYASPVAGDGKIFIASHNGVVAVLRAGGQQELLASNALEEEIFATPAIVGGRLYVRTVSALYCFGTR
ncbi:MAG TPA: PQQ-binding-like beta-propeller repeat protein [Bryobacteraceae bacterium]|nr:PQQ-binding-like beta-propeller repeat protein [Bryobacteraceae bacterium]